MKRKVLIHNLTFLLSFTLLGIGFNFHETSFLEPSGLHLWRQADCLSFTLNYQDGNALWQPELHNQLAQQGTAGYSVGEFPIVYFLVGNIWKLTGKKIWIFRLLALGIFFLGLWSLFRAFYKLGFHWLLSLMAPLLLLAFPFFVYYSNGFLPNTLAISFVFMAWLNIVRYGIGGKFHWFIVACALFVLGALLKVTAAISFIALMASLTFYFLFKKRERPTYLQPFLRPGVVIALLVSLLTIGAWYLAARYYNDMNKGYFTFNYASPIWQMSGAEIYHVLQEIRQKWLAQIIAPPLIAFLCLCFIAIVLFFRKLPLALKLLLPFLVLGVASYALLWFDLLEPHDYYWTDGMILAPFFTLGFMYLLREKLQKPIAQYLTAAIFLLAGFTGISYSLERTEERFYGYWQSLDHISRSLEGIDSYLDSLGVSREAKVISYPDQSYNSSLYFIDRSGWTGMNHLSVTDEVLDKVNKGARYLVLNLPDEAPEPPAFRVLDKKRIGTYRNVRVFRIKPGFYYDFEVSDGLPRWMQYHQTDSVPFEGTYALASRGKEFLGETFLQSLKPGSRVEATVWVRSGSSKAALPVIQSVEEKLAYRQNWTDVERRGDWILMKQELLISPEIAREGVKVFLWNPGRHQKVVYDNYKVKVYEP